MTNNSHAAIAILVVANGLVGCSNPAAIPSAPSAPSAVSQPNPGAVVVFKDPLTGLATSNVHDAQDHVVQFTTANELIWIDGTHLAGHLADGPGHRVLGSAPVAPEPSCQCWLVVRFGAVNGERRAYLTADVGHSNPGTVVDLEITGSALVVRWSDFFPPGAYTLSGVITEATPTGLVPIGNAEVWRLDEEQSGWDHGTTDTNGFYQLHGLSDGSRKATFSKDGYQKLDLGDVPVHGDTRFDVQLQR